MNQILDGDFDIDKPNFRRFDETEYAVKFRRYPGGNLKATIVQFSAIAKERASFMFHNPGYISLKPKDELSLEAKEAKRLASHERNISRARSVVTDLIMMLEGDRLITLTYRDNVQDREKVKADLKEFLRLVRKRYEDFKYVAVPELQERGAFHIHIAVKGFFDINYLRACWYRAIGGNVGDTGDSTLGQIDITSPKEKKWGSRSESWRSKELARYLTKYLHKTFDASQFDKKRYWSARDLKKPPVVRFWLCASNMYEAIPELINRLVFSDGLNEDDFSMWISEGGGVFSISGACDSD